MLGVFGIMQVSDLFDGRAVLAGQGHEGWIDEGGVTHFQDVSERQAVLEAIEIEQRLDLAIQAAAGALARTASNAEAPN